MYELARFAGDRFRRINSIIEAEANIISGYINLVASVSYPFPEAMEALRYPFHVTPTEGMPGKRLFPAPGPIDKIESLSRELLRSLLHYGPDYEATIQPHSGTQANQVVFNAVLSHGDRVLSLEPSHGGHISHTMLVGKRNPVIHYSLGKDGRLDYDQIEELAVIHEPKLLIAGTSSYPREIDYRRLGEIASKAGAFLHADISHTAIFIASGLHASPFPFAATASFNMMKNLRGPSGGVLVYRADLQKKIGYGLFPMTQGGPLENVLFAKLVTLECLSQTDIRAYASRISANASQLASICASAGIPVVTGGTDSHLVLLDLTHVGRPGVEVEKHLEQCLILANRNLVPGDTTNPWVTSGIRFGTTCVTILEYDEEAIRRLGAAIVAIIMNRPSKEDRENLLALIDKYHRALSTSSAVKG